VYADTDRHWAELSLSRFTDPLLPRPHSLLYPDWNCECADAAALATEIDDHPSSLSELNVFDLQRCEFLPTQSATDEESDDLIVALTL
jgi:hypothetical protein